MLCDTADISVCVTWLNSPTKFFFLFGLPGTAKEVVEVFVSKLMTLSRWSFRANLIVVELHNVSGQHDLAAARCGSHRQGEYFEVN